MTLDAGTKLGRYEIRSKIGAGAALRSNDVWGGALNVQA